jgi:hypothetical protein
MKVGKENLDGRLEKMKWALLDNGRMNRRRKAALPQPKGR